MWSLRDILNFWRREKNFIAGIIPFLFEILWTENKTSWEYVEVNVVHLTSVRVAVSRRKVSWNKSETFCLKISQSWKISLGGAFMVFLKISETKKLRSTRFSFFWSNFLSQCTKIIRSGTLWCFWRFPVPKNSCMKGVSSVFLCHSTENCSRRDLLVFVNTCVCLAYAELEGIEKIIQRKPLGEKFEKPFWSWKCYWKYSKKKNKVHTKVSNLFHEVPTRNLRRK